MKPHNNRTKIIATVGPAIESREMIAALIRAGVNIFRLNLSHGNEEKHRAVIELVQSVNDELGTHVGLLADLQGPKIRTGNVPNGKIMLPEGHELILTTDNVECTPEMVSVSYEQFVRDVAEGDHVLVDDGKLELQVLEHIDATKVRARVIYGGELSSRKGINMPHTRISEPSLTDADKANLRWVLECDIQWIALSFVRRADDLKELRGIINYHNKDVRIIAKIERPEALEEIDGIIDACDGIMVARGDLGVELPMERIPMIQKHLTRRCMDACKPVVIATQMMESMISHFRPTRAEATDVANAVFDGADAVMLSAETSVGNYPVKVVEAMRNIIAEVEKETMIYNRNIKPDKNSPTYLNDAICYNATTIAMHVNARAILGMTRSGYTAFRLACQRPNSNIYIFTDSHQLIKTLSLVWGVEAFYYNRFESTDKTIAEVQEILKEKGLILRGDIVLNTGSMPLGSRSRTNMIKIGVVR
jgi:pyruvate kinase